ncbi:sigma-54 interaction domain-containing protein [Teredinibacter turnerae]|uniref:sigma-54 interaction domain-containing protein n=1 Tax=Teredinibacter turnerae TaxID=2426 RepID=UPI000380F7F5|nr:sigma-54 dependent transcriptional regulator [Teredinibacter turnerae]
MHILISWVGNADLEGVANPDNPGPLTRIARHERYDEIHLLHNQRKNVVKPLRAAIESASGAITHVHPVQLASPIHFGDIYQALDGVLSQLSEKHTNPTITIQLTSGTSAMSAVSILVGKTKYAARFVQASREQGVQVEDIPFDIAADFLPTIAKRQDQKLEGLFAGLAPNTAAFDDIISQSPVMEALKQKAAILAQRDVPVLIYGETGTGKELFAKAIHNASARASQPMLVLNCGAIPKDLIDATLFGYVKGAFTGAAKDTSGYFGDADGGTLFLDEFGELPLDSQVRLLRVLQDGSYTPVGSTVAKSTDVRIIAATNKNLMDEVAAGRFREDLFYRVAIGVLHLPPLRERSGDLLLLTTSILDKIAEESDSANVVTGKGKEKEEAQNGKEKHKKLSVKARKLIQGHPWPGNVRELQATLLRATLWHTGDTLSDEDIRSALISTSSRQAGILDRDVSQGIDLNELCDDVVRHYVPLALEAAQGKKTKAAELLGLNNYQTLENKMRKLNLI